MTDFRKLLALAGLLLGCPAAARAASSVFNVRDHGAVGDGKTLDTVALNKTIDACAASGGGQVFVPPGKYLTGTIRLRSNITLVLDAGAEIVGTSDLEQYQHFTPPGHTPLASRLWWHRALLLGEGVENVTITGRGAINGNKVFDAQGEEHMRGPHAVLFGNCKNIALRDISIRDAANYAVMLEFTSHVEVRGVKITGGWDGVHFRGWKDNPCRDVTISDCEFYTGDDCIAGWYWEHVLIDRCVINSSCNGIRLIGPATDLIIHGCLFFGPGRNEHRTSREHHRTNMLAGLCLEPGSWDRTEGALDDVKISDITMHDVTTPLYLSLRSGNTAGRISISRLSATGCYLAAASIESWAEAPIDFVSLRDVSLEFTGGGTPEQARAPVKRPGADAHPLPAWGFYAKNVKTLQLENVRLSLQKDDARPAIIGHGIDTLELDTFRFPRAEGAPLILDDVHNVRLADTSIKLLDARCTDLRVTTDPFAASATVQNGAEEGLAKIELSVDGQATARWVWLKAGETKDVTFSGLAVSGPGKHQLQCGRVVVIR